MFNTNAHKYLTAVIVYCALLFASTVGLALPTPPKLTILHPTRKQVELLKSIALSIPQGPRREGFKCQDNLGIFSLADAQVATSRFNTLNGILIFLYGPNFPASLDASVQQFNRLPPIYRDLGHPGHYDAKELKRISQAIARALSDVETSNQAPILSEDAEEDILLTMREGLVEEAPATHIDIGDSGYFERSPMLENLDLMLQVINTFNFKGPYATLLRSNIPQVRLISSRWRRITRYIPRPQVLGMLEAP